MKRWHLIGPCLVLPALLLVIAACGGSSSGSSAKKKPTPTPTPAGNVQAQAPINGVVAILGKPGAAPGAGTIQGNANGSSSSNAGRKGTADGPCPVSGQGTVHPDGSFSFSICASVGDRIDLLYNGNTSLGFAIVPSENALPQCPAGFRTFTYTNSGLDTIWIGLATGGGPPPTACSTSDSTTCGPNQVCVNSNACTSNAQCADANQCDLNSNTCQQAPSTVCAGGSSASTVTLSQNECVGRLGASCAQAGCDTGFTCDTNTGLCFGPSGSNTTCSTQANCGTATSCTWTNQVSECTGGTCFFTPINPGENTACTSDSNCPQGQTCNTNLGLCQYSPSTIPQSALELPPSSQTNICLPGGVAPSSYWAQPISVGPMTGQPKITNTTTLCTLDTDCASGRCVISGTSGPFAPHVPPSATDCSQAKPGQTCTCFPIVGWSGNTFARTGCESDGTLCDTGDCGNAAYQACPVGKGGNPPNTLAEFTLQANAVDFYDVSIINGVNTSLQMAPNPSSSPSPAPGTVNYECETAGATSAQGGLSACSWNFSLNNIPGFGDQTSLLTQVSLPSCNPTSAGCPAGSTCQPTGVNPTNQATTYTCIPNQPACATSSDCPGSLPCINGFCAPTAQCGSNGQCAQGTNCVNGLCVSNVCTTDSDCSSSATGLESATCQSGVCIPLTCDASVSCPAGFSCDMGGGGFGTCVSSQASCSATNPCPNSHQVCSIPSGQQTGTCVTQLQCPQDGACPVNSLCVAGGYCTPGSCTTDSDCTGVSGTCNTQNGQCVPLGCDSDVSCPSGMECTAGGTCVVSCSSSSDCSSSSFGATCGTTLVGGNLMETCGASTGGLWTYDDFCPQVKPGQQYGPVDCNATAQTPPSGQPDAIANMFGCNGNPVGSAVSCYNTAAATSFCCGCPTASSVIGTSGWPSVLGSSFTNCTQTSAAWQNDVMPWLEYLKNGCPTAYTFPFDDATSTFTCSSAGTSSTVQNAMSYNLTFGSYQIAQPGAAASRRR